MSNITLPSTIKEWEKEAKSQGVLNRSVHELLEVASASKIGFKQYYSLRVLWKVTMKDLPNANILGFSKADPIYRTASDYLKKSQSWQDYLANVSSGPLPFSADRVRDIGAFSNVLYYQLHVEPVQSLNSADQAMGLVPSKFSPRRSPATPSVLNQPETPSLSTSRGRHAMKKSSYLDPDYSFDDTFVSENSFAPPDPQSPITTATIAPSEDEQIVNIALILWLQTLVMFHPQIQLERLKWSVKRLKFDFGEWEARMDGCLRKNREVKAIVEVKPYARSNYLDAIQKQESAQMASWIRNFPFDGGWLVMRDGREFERRLLISQDSIEIYLTVAEFESADRDYLLFEDQDEATERSFMTMYQYGPWDTTDKEHMEHLGKLLLAFALRFCQSSNDPFKAGSGSSTTLTAPGKLGAPRPPMPSAAPKNPTKTGKTGTTIATKKSVPPGKPEKLKYESTEATGTSAPPKKPSMGKEKTPEVTETTGATGMTGTTQPTGTTRTTKISGKSAPPAKSKNLKTEEAERTEQSAPSEKPKIDTTETDETAAPTETTRVTQKPTSSKQSGKGKGKMVDTTEGTEARGSSTTTRTTGLSRTILPFRGSGKLKDKEAE